MRDLTVTGGFVATAFGGAIATNGALTIEASVFDSNNTTAASGGGAVGAVGAITITDSVFSGNESTNGGGAIIADSTVDVTRSVFTDNTDTGQNGGAINGNGDITVTGSSFVGNSAADNGGAIGTGGDVHVANTTISANTAGDGVGGGINSLGYVSHDHATIVANSSTEGGANINADTLGAQFGDSRFASVIALPGGGRPNCDSNASIPTTAGHNYSDDTSCILFGPDDIQDGADPLLGQARDNGGHDDTAITEGGNPIVALESMYPLLGSPLIDAIKPDDCSTDPALAVDQRGVTRPFGTDCDIGAIEAVFPAHGFSDATPFFEATIRWVTSTVNTPQILNGFPNGTFGQELDITRGQAARLYYRGAGTPDPTEFDEHGFSDVTPFYEDAVRWAKGVGLFNGYPDNTFRQGDPITRGQYIRSLYNFAGTKDVGHEDPHGLTDVTPFYEDAVKWAKAFDLANGFPDNTFRQNNDIKRGNAARTFYNTAQTKIAWQDTMTAPPNMLFRPNLAP